MVRAGDMCPAPPKYQAPTASDIAKDDHRIHVDSDDAALDAAGHAVLNGRVRVRQDARSVTSDSVNYDEKTGRVSVKGAVDFEDPKLRVRSDSGHYDINGAANFDQSNFQLMDRNGRGFAKELDVRPDGKLSLTSVRYTTCPVGNEDWMLQASSLNLDTKVQEGVARDVTMRFKDVPIFYTPYISFPVGDERKSGLLFPSFGHSGNNGFELQVPYYFNLAPNYDLVLTPGLLSRRGVQLGEQFRYLTASSHGEVDATFLPSDAVAHSDRSYIRITDITDFKRGMRFDADIASVSDSKYFEDFAVGSDQTSVTFLERRADILYYDDAWRVRGELQNFQTIDVVNVLTTCPNGVSLSPGRCDERPYSRVPRIEATALWPMPDTPIEFALDSEIVNFLREVGPTGVRVHAAPEIRWSSREPGYFFEPAIGYDFTQYDLKNAAADGPNASSTPTRALPYARVDAGLVFEREAGSRGQRTQTLEPRVVYSYVPYRNQDGLPIFDTGLPDLNLTELFRTNRYVGEDRIGDANQVALALTSRLFDHLSGAQYLSATIGQIRYFSIPKVGLPVDTALLSTGTGQTLVTIPGVNPLALPGQALVNSRGQILMVMPGQYVSGLPLQTFATTASGQAQTFPASDIVADVAVTAYKHFSLNFDYLWNPYTSQTDKTEVSLQYRPDSTRVVNIGYRFQQNVLTQGVILKQWDGSVAWPISQHWNTVGRWVYSLQDRKTVEQVAGFEYKSCCYRVQLVQRRYITNRAGGLDTSIALQLELTGLSSVGKRADSFLEQSIRGYSTRDPNAQNQAP
jgi:LPS-assembly protein